MAISIHELRKPNASENPWQSAPVFSSAANTSPFHVASVAPTAFSWQAQAPKQAQAACTLPTNGTPRSRGILKFVNYLYDRQ
ncbi:hypothetical protein [Vampirovibrio chlorellavorus]|uniref:hypothetical protein n=1 Tax=Vampirovibrio chlorellavorus TaxID=758823 RepID=UPI0026EE3E4A|nr:hypothetical protein [Vampirovibrio chlorellavorus]